MFELYADKNKLTVQAKEDITSGSVNAYRVRFRFSSDWDGLSRTAVFRLACREKLVLLDESGECVIPWEVLTRPGWYLMAGVCGRQGEELVLPTVWANLGPVLKGADGGEPTRPPTPELWRQELDSKGDRLAYTEEGELGLYCAGRRLSSVPVSRDVPFGIGHGLTIENGDLTVVTTGDFSGDNTLPMTAAGVETVVGNIAALLGTI